jgi:hypothetical protein
LAPVFRRDECEFASSRSLRRRDMRDGMALSRPAPLWCFWFGVVSSVRVSFRFVFCLQHTKKCLSVLVLCGGR